MGVPNENFFCIIVDFQSEATEESRQVVLSSLARL